MHEVRQFPTGVNGIDAVSLSTTRHFPRHAHDQFGIGTMTSGGHRSWSSLGWVEASAGDIIMVNPGEIHDGVSCNGMPRSWKMLFFEPEVLANILGEEINTKAINLLPVVRDQRQASQFDRLFATLTNRQPGDALQKEERLLTTVAHAFRHHSSQRSHERVVLPGIDKVLKRIDSSPECPFTLEQMASLANASRFQFLRKFARATGVTPHAYIVQKRIRLAQRLLANGMDLTQASVEAGFADQSHMTRAFLRQLGVTPACYRDAVCDNRRRAISFKTRSLSQ